MHMWCKPNVMWLAMIFSAGAASQEMPPPPSEPVIFLPDARSVDSSMVLDQNQLATLMKDAEAGDGFAAFRLARHYESLQSANQAQYWLHYSAARGHSAAQNNIWFDLKDNEDCKSRLEALAWIRSSALAGEEWKKHEAELFAETVKPCLRD